MKKLAYLCLLVTCTYCASQAQSYRKLHKQAVVVDSHNDFLSQSIEQHVSFDQDLSGKTMSDLGRMKAGGIDVQVFSIFCDETYGNGRAFAYANREIDSLYAVVRRNPMRMTLVTDARGIARAVKAHKLAAMLGVEGGHMIEDDLGKLDSFYRRGVRYMTLTWNNSTSWASSAKDESEHTILQGRHAGLNEFGRTVVSRMNQLGMLVDLSHVGEQTFSDAIAHSTKPVLVSHSAVYKLCPVFRNLKDDQIRAVGKNGGVIQVNFYSGFLDSTYLRKQGIFVKRHSAEHDSLAAAKKPEYAISSFLAAKYKRETDSLRPPLSLLLDHIDYLVKMIGADHVGLGSDFDGIESSPLGLDGVKDFARITEALKHRGYSDVDVVKILGGNFIRVLAAQK